MRDLEPKKIHGLGRLRKYGNSPGIRSCSDPPPEIRTSFDSRPYTRSGRVLKLKKCSPHNHWSQSPPPPSPPVWQERETMKPTHNREKSHVKQNCDCFRPCFWLFEKRRVSFSCVEHKARRMKMTQQKMPLIQTPNKTLTILHWWYSSPGRHKITSVHQLQIHGTGGVVRYYQVDVTWLKGLP